MATWRKLLLLLLLLLATGGRGAPAILLGGSITWRLDKNYENNRIMYFKAHTFFNRVDLSTYTLALYQRVTNPTVTFDVEEIMGSITVSCVGCTGPYRFPNNFRVVFLDTNVVEGEHEFPFTVPNAAQSVTAYLVWKINGVYTNITYAAGQDNSPGLMARCKFTGPSSVPCIMNWDSVDMPPATDFMLSTTFIVPKGDFTLVRDQQVLNRNSPQALVRGWMSLNSNNNIIQVSIRTVASAGLGAIRCARDGSTFTKSGCGMDKVLVVMSVCSWKLNSCTRLQIMRTSLTPCTMGTFITSTSQLKLPLATEGTITRSRPQANFECKWNERCSFTVYAAMFSNIGQSMLIGGGITALNVTFGRSSKNFSSFDQVSRNFPDMTQLLIPPTGRHWIVQGRVLPGKLSFSSRHEL
eukprot:760789-Hanusia_phi.AAC.2